MPAAASCSLAIHTFVGLHALPGDLDVDATDLQVSEDDALERGAVDGWADHAGSIEIIHHPEAPPIRVLVTLLHEVVHLALPEDEHHGALFRSTFAAAAEEAWGLDLGDELDADGPGEGYDALQGPLPAPTAVVGPGEALAGAARGGGRARRGACGSPASDEQRGLNG